MYGMVNGFLQERLVDTHGEKAWGDIKKRAGLDVEHFVSMEAYPDEVSFGIVGAASEVLNIPASDLLSDFGEHWIAHTNAGQYRQLYRMSGDSLVEFLRNLDNLHVNVANVMPELRPPAFKCTDVTETSLRLHYYSERDGMAPFVMGLVTGLGNHFGTPVTISHDKPKGETLDHDEFAVVFLDKSA